jgi:hypothetical protein
MAGESGKPKSSLATSVGNITGTQKMSERVSFFLGTVSLLLKIHPVKRSIELKTIVIVL